MKLPGGQDAIVDRKKLIGYCLSPVHPRGKHKARLFASVLGYTRQNADELRAALVAAAAEEEARHAFSDRFGERYVIESSVTGPLGTGTGRSAWILRHGEERPHLTSCHVK